MICLISLNKFSDVLPVFTCASAIGNLWSICFRVNVLRPSRYFVLYLALDAAEENSLSTLITTCCDS